MFVSHTLLLSQMAGGLVDATVYTVPKEWWSGQTFSQMSVGFGVVTALRSDWQLVPVCVLFPLPAEW